jgi:hypothetical protein
MLGRIILSLSVLSLSALPASAQDLTEALHLSDVKVQGTARSMGFGNALGSVGADFSSLAVNPAGIGVYRTSEVMFTPSLWVNSASSQYLGTTTGDGNTRFNINNFGIVLTNAPKGKRYEHRDWKAVSFGFGFNRVADFNRNYSYSGRNMNSSASQSFESDANQYPGDVGTVGMPGYIGWQSYLLEFDSIRGKYYSIVPFTGGVNQYKSVIQNGRINEYDFSVGGNYKEKLMLGVTLGITDVEYEVSSSYTESIAANNTAPNPAQFSSFNYNQYYTLSGSGINLKLGAIYKPTDFLRLGAAIHTPTAYSLSNLYSPYVSSTMGGGTAILTASDGSLADNIFDYSFTTPWRGVLSAAFVLKGLGFITADYEYVGYGSVGYWYPIDNSAYEGAINSALENTYSGTSNFRIGAEALLTKYFMARAGFGYYGSPYRVSDYSDGRIDLSLGVGFRFRHFFTDLAWVGRMYNEQQMPYDIDFAHVVSGPAVALPVASTDVFINNIAWTIGVKF